MDHNEDSTWQMGKGKEDALEGEKEGKRTWKSKKKLPQPLPQRQCNVVVHNASLCVNLGCVNLGMI